jgi:hypothetical protein
MFPLLTNRLAAVDPYSIPAAILFGPARCDNSQNCCGARLLAENTAGCRSNQKRGEKTMLYQGDNEALKKYSLVMVLFGASLFGLPLMFEFLPDQFRWHEPAVNMANEHMITAMYFALGICFIAAAKDPVKNAILIDYTIISSILHALVMAYYALFVLETEMPHMWGDIPYLFLVAAGFTIYHPKRVARASA